MIETDSQNYQYEAPCDKKNLIWKYITFVSFAAWLPCHCVLVGLPFFQAKVGPLNVNHHSALICYPVVLFVPALLVGILMLLRPIKVGGFYILMKIGLVVQLAVSFIWGICLEYLHKSHQIWNISLISISLLGIC